MTTNETLKLILRELADIKRTLEAIIPKSAARQDAEWLASLPHEERKRILKAR